MTRTTAKGMAALLAAVLLGGAAATAQPGRNGEMYFSDMASHREINRARVEKAYITCLRNENRGVVESALAHVAWMRLTLPDRSFDDLRAEVDRLAACAECPVIRTHAYLTALVFDHPKLFQGVLEAAPENEQVLFGALNARLQEALLSSAENVFVR